MGKLKTITNSQTKKLEYCRSIGEIVCHEVNENGYMNLIVKTRSKLAPVKELCYGRAGGLHREAWYKVIDPATNIPEGIIYEWSLIRGCTYSEGRRY